MTSRAKTRWDNALRMLCAAALFLLGFAHLGPALAAPLPAIERALYALPDGSLPDFCQTGLGEDGKDQPGHKHVCSACRFFWALLAPPNGSPGERLEGSRTPAVPITAVRPTPQFHSPNASPRGPPQVVTRL
ncbi:hypothetical protein [Ensifer adhaerens]|uniref:hypothetical protein n=1 Tax=Ensifer adhaerens TaxID=106592 RepID=UPI00117827F6|nr:hypothetical protein [Ensifer adhaerens]